MNYNFFKIATSNRDARFIQTVNMEEAQRPSIGTQLILSRSKGLWKVVLVTPADNPAGTSNTYFVEKIRDHIFR